MPAIEINDRHGKAVKTAASIPKIHIHPELVRLGFLEYAAAIKSAKRSRLFPELTRGADGYDSSSYSKFFGRFLAKTGVKARRNGFHSLRQHASTFRFRGFSHEEARFSR